MKSFPLMVALVVALGFSSAAGAQQSATGYDARALLAKAAAAVKADKARALASFNDPYGGFRDRDLYVFCFDRKSGITLAGQPATRGIDVRTLKDPTGKRFGREMFANVSDGGIIIVDYVFPKPYSIVPVPKESFIEGLGDVACGVGYYKPFAQASEDVSRMGRVQHACTVVMGLEPGTLYDTCVKSLGDTLFQIDQARLISTGEYSCARSGLTPGTPSFAACVESGPGF